LSPGSTPHPPSSENGSGDLGEWEGLGVCAGGRGRCKVRVLLPQLWQLLVPSEPFPGEQCLLMLCRPCPAGGGTCPK
uniref:Uncharacterized protein n=1 Tax=Aquila chrysaetos chrysaetos TaxID=223781 RepID=A0A663DM05_AQUCH